MNFKSLIVISILALAGCGGGGGTNGASNGSSAVFATNAGSAAIGAAMSNASIGIQPLPSDSNAEVIITADADGKFTIPYGTKLPAVVKATSANKQWTYYGYIKSADQVGIPVNPITTTLLTLAAGGHPSTITTAISDPALSTARTQTATLFNALLAATSQSNATDFLSKTFSTDHTGLDLVLDSIGIQLSNTGSINIINKMTGEVALINKENISPISFDAAASNKINDLPIQLCANFLKQITSDKLINDPAVYDANFLDQGRNKDAFITQIQNVILSNFKVSMPLFVGLDANQNLKFGVQLQNSSTGDYLVDYGLTVKKDVVSGNCVIVGDQFPFEITIQPAIKTTLRADGLSSNVYEKYSGLEIFIGAHNDWTFASNDINSTRIGSARVDVCDSTNACVLLATLTNQSLSARGIFDIDGIFSNNTLRMLGGSGFNLFTDVTNPIKVTFFSSAVAPTTGNSNSIGVVYTRATGLPFTDAEVAQITLPSVSNYMLLADVISNPDLQWSAGTGIISEFGVYSTNNSVVNNKTVFLLKGGTGTTNFAVSDPANPFYKSIHLSAHIPNRPGMLETKYIWAPTCPSCY